MNRIDRNENPNDDDFLRGALHGAADAMPGAGVDDLNVSFGVVRDRVRRRRAVKIGGVTGAGLALVGVLAFGATQTPLLDRAGPVLPGTSQSATPETSPSAPPPSDGPIGPPARDNIEFGYTPSWLEWSDLSCGMPVEDLASTAPGWSVAPAGDVYARTSDIEGETSTSRGMAATVQAGEGTLDVAPVLVWSQGGVVVDFGPNVFESPGQQEPLLGAGDGAVEAQGGAMQTCLPNGPEDQTFEFALFAGDYDVRVVAFPQTASGEWATVVSDPVQVRIDADGDAHTATGTRGGDATIEPLELAEGELSRFVLDRSTDWVTAELTQRGYVTTGTPLVSAECESTDPADTVTYEVVQPSTNEALASEEILCDGSRYESLPVVGGDQEALDIRLTSVPDGVARLWATFGPTPGNAAGECSASNLGMDYDPAGSPSAGAGETAQAIVEAANACDSERLIELANEHPTELLITGEPADQVFALPEGGEEHYRTLVALLAGTVGADQGDGTIVWPRVVTEEFQDSDEAWAEVVEAGLVTAEDAAAQRADELFGYTGMRIGIDSAGTWRYYSATP